MRARDEKSRALEAERAPEYGPPLLNHNNIAAAWNAYLCNRPDPGGPVSAYDVANMMTLTKVIRLAHRAKADSFDDAHVYLEFAQRFSAPGLTDPRRVGSAGESYR